MGMIAHNEEQDQGRLRNHKRISSDSLYNAYFRLRELTRLGYENRNYIPDNIAFPNFNE